MIGGCLLFSRARPPGVESWSASTAQKISRSASWRNVVELLVVPATVVESMKSAVPRDPLVLLLNGPLSPRGCRMTASAFDARAWHDGRGFIQGQIYLADDKYVSEALKAAFGLELKRSR